ncbi:Serine/threonine-protein kinase pkn1 [Halioglobus japonicus]|nr:Serine/threonine-protein kinase pkn1 [Halioglobus japonicus]
MPNEPVTIAPSGFTPLEDAASKPPAPRKKGRWLLIACLLLFVLALLFLFTARSLQITVNAEVPAQVSVGGLVLPFGNRYLLLPGAYEVSAAAEGYQALVTTVEVDDRDDQTLELTLNALPGLISIDSSPQGASVTVDGESVGKTPLVDLPLAQGEYQLLLEEPRHLPLTQTLQVTGRNVQQDIAVQLAPAWAMVTIDSVPAGATILLDGEAAGTTPATIEVLQGEHQLMLQMDTFANWQKTLRIEADKDQDLGQVNLQPAAGALTLNSVPSAANVTLDGEFQGQTPLTIDVSPGTVHQLDVFKPGYKRYNDSVEMAAATTDERTVTLQAQLGEVRLRISPANAVVRINGKAIGAGVQTLSLPAVEHVVEVSLDGYAPVRKSVTPRPGLPQLVDVTLQTQQAVTEARIKPEITTPLGQTLLLFKPAESAMADFTMGSSRREPGRRANEVLHPVALRRMFYLQTTEVTNAQFRQFQSGHNSGQIEGNSLNQDHQPAVQVSWQQAAAFCNWLSAREGLPPFYRQSNGIITGYNSSATGYRLPSEAEWAWAARASGDKLVLFPWGDTFPPTLIAENYADDTSAYVTGRVLNGYKDGYVVSAPVASFKPNQHGLYDMGGNVSEWVHDVYTIPSANAATAKDPLGGQTGDNYVIRGAAWTHAKLSELRLTYRDYGQAGRDDVGFRLARYAE